jgi:hypothetical protein
MLAPSISRMLIYVCALCCRPYAVGRLGRTEDPLGFHNFRHSLATSLVKLKVDPKTVQGVLRHEDFGTTMELYAQSDMESMRDAKGKFLEQLMGDRIHLLTSEFSENHGLDRGLEVSALGR